MCLTIYSIQSSQRAVKTSYYITPISYRKVRDGGLLIVPPRLRQRIVEK